MSLKPCKECGTQVSTDATACPKCGAKQPKRTKTVTWLVGGFFAFVVFSAVFNTARRPPLSAEAVAANKVDEARQDKELRFASVGAMTLRKSMKDPAAFTLTSLRVKPTGAACYDYRAKNTFGAILPGSAILTSAGRLLVEERDGNAFVKAWNSECTVAGGQDISGLVTRIVSRE
jgi:hypothetical protein